MVRWLCLGVVVPAKDGGTRLGGDDSGGAGLVGRGCDCGCLGWKRWVGEDGSRGLGGFEASSWVCWEWGGGRGG